MGTPESPATGDGPLDAILRIGSGFRAAKLLFVAVEVGLFAHLAAGPATLAELAARTGLAPTRLRVLIHAMVALGLVERDGETFRNGLAAAAYLSGQGPGDLRPALRFWDQLSYPYWAQLEDTVRTGRPRERLRGDEEQRLFSEGVEALSAAAADALTTAYDFRGHRRVLDLGGGTGSWLLALLRRHSHLRAVVVAADFWQDPIPAGHDAILVANVLHGMTAERNTLLLRRIRAAVAPGARLLLADCWTDPTHTAPLLALLQAGEFLVYTGEGDVYSVAEVEAWLRASGWQPRAHLPLVPPQSVVVAEAVEAVA